jgi:DNA recombination protein RmuC
MSSMPLIAILIAILALAAVAVILQIVLLFRKGGVDLTPVQQVLRLSEQACERVERSVREEIATNREEAGKAFQQSREELAQALKGVGDTLLQQLGVLTRVTDQKLERVREALEQRLQVIHEESTRKLEQLRQESGTAARQMREDTSNSLKASNDSVLNTMTGISELQKKEMLTFTHQLGRLTASNEQQLAALRTAVEEKLRAIQDDNARQLEQMRVTVDEKLQGTLEKRLGESFKQVSERLEQVYKGLGEMQTLATGVGDLKKVLTNVKTRGTWGEVQLGAMLEQVLTPEQYATNVSTKDSGERVEYAIRLPGRSEDENDEVIWLPIDAKFPVEDYQRLVDAQERAEAQPAEEAARQLENRIKQGAGDICRKYLNPPHTTDFGILFLPTEGLFAEVIRRPGLAEFIQREYRVVIAGPTTLWSILNSLQMGFRTLAIQKRSSEVWNLLAAVKTEWTRYGEVLEKVQKKLHEASTTIEKAQTRTRAIGRKLRGVQELPLTEAQTVLMVENNMENPDDEIDAD